MKSSRVYEVILTWLGTCGNFCLQQNVPIAKGLNIRALCPLTTHIHLKSVARLLDRSVRSRNSNRRLEWPAGGEGSGWSGWEWRATVVDPAVTASSSAPTTTVAAVAANRAAALATANTVTQVHPQVYHMPVEGQNGKLVWKVNNQWEVLNYISFYSG